MRGSKRLHESILNATLILLGREAHHLGRFFRNEVGAAYREENGRRQWVHYGVLGSADIQGILVGGKHISIEIKSGNATQQDNQRRYEAMVKSLGGFYFVAHSPEEALEFVLRAATL